MLPLQGLRVVGLGDSRASRATALLADLGADVCCVDLAALACQAARADSAWTELLRHADVSIEDCPGGTLECLGLGCHAWAALNPDLVRVSITGFGQTGPRQHDASCDLVASAAGGQLFLCGAADEPPVQLHGQATCHASGLTAAIGALLGLARRRRTGRGAHIDLSAQEVVASMLEHALVQYLSEGRVAQRRGGLAWNGSSFILPCRDGHILASIATQWDTLIEWLAAEGMDDDLGDPRWRDEGLRCAEVGHIVEVLGRWTATHQVQPLFHAAQALRLPWAPVHSPEQAAQCPQLAARAYAGVPYRFSAPSMAAQQQPLPALIPGAAPLQGLRVLDFSWVLAGPYATRILGDFGAEVIKVQSARTSAPLDAAPYFEMWNRNKLGLALDMSHPEARELVLALVRECDVLVENFSPRVMANWGLDYEVLQAVNPRLVMLSLSAMGHTGPWRDYVAFGPGLQALSGMTLLSSADPAQPTGLSYAHGDHVMGLYGALALLAALEGRARSGQGSFIDLSGYEAMATLALAPRPSAEGAPEGVYRCLGTDRWCVLSVRDDAQWQHLCQLAGEPGWSQCPEFANAASRVEHAAALDALIGQWTAGQSAVALVARLQQAGIAAAVVQDTADLFHDPHLKARGFFAAVDHPRRGKTWIDRSPIRFTDDANVRWAEAPKLGADSERVLSTVLGLEPGQIDRYRRIGVLR